jgi:probable F420-dependent oxidoreductase
MKISYHLPVEDVSQPDQFHTAAAIAEMVGAMEQAGMEACYVTDHPAPSEKWLKSGGHHAMDPFVALSFAAAASTRIKLHTHILVLAYRNPFMSAKSIASLDRLSGGRVILGVGHGYMEEEFAALGVEFATRGAAMEESLAVMRQAWGGGTVAHKGAKFDAVGNVSLPTPVQQNGPAVWVGGNSGNAMRLAAGSCDGWAPFPASPKASARTHTQALTDIPTLKDKIRQIHEMRAAAGRSGSFDICMVPFQALMQAGARPEAQKLIDELAALAEAGVTWSAISLPSPSRAAFVESAQWFAAEVRPHLPKA